MTTPLVQELREMAETGRAVEARGLTFVADPEWFARWADQIEAAEINDTDGVIDRLRRWATACEDSDDAETELPGVFLPNTITGDFYDVLNAAADRLSKATPSRAGGGEVSEDKKGPMWPIPKPPTVADAEAAIDTALSDASNAVKVLSTMLRKTNLQGFAVADEILGSIAYAQKMRAALHGAGARGD